MTDNKKEKQEPIAVEVILDMSNAEQREARVKNAMEIILNSKSPKKDRDWAAEILKGLSTRVETLERGAAIEKAIANQRFNNLKVNNALQYLREIKCFISGMITNSAVLGDAINSSHLHTITGVTNKLEEEV